MSNGVGLYPELHYISLCTGGGGLDHGIELAIPNARAAVCVEREAFAIAQLVAQMEQGFLAQAPVFSDVRAFNGRRWRGLVDGVIGGIPCQGHSTAGKKLGSLDERDLWSPTRRIIAQSRPFFVLIENVSGMLHPGADEIAGAERVWRDLRKLGFAVEGGLFTAAEVGASHQRERVFILGVADYALCGWGDVASSGGCGERKGQDRGCGSDVVDAARSRYWSGREQRNLHSSHGRQDGELLRQSGGAVEQLADSDSERLERQWADAGAQGRQDARRPSRLRNGAIVGDEPTIRSGRSAVASANNAVANANISEFRGEPSTWELAILQQDDGYGGISGQECLADANSNEQTAQRGDVGEVQGTEEGEGGPEYGPPLFGRCGFTPFAPGPGDVDGWREILERAPHLEPAIRSVADGLASTRIDWLRLLGNGVVPLQAAYAFRVLATRLAERGSAAATLLVRMIEEND